jgi:hypothetical protein
VGQWFWKEPSSISDSVQYYFKTSDGMNALCFEDPMNMGQWRAGSWGAERGPDPVLEFTDFKNNIMNNFGDSVFL